MKWICCLLLVIATPSQAADPRSRPEWTAPCTFGGKDFSIRFKSRSGDAYSDDQSVAFVRGKETRMLAVAPGLYESAEFTSETANHCKGIGAFDWTHGTLLLLIPRNDRPSSDQLIALVIDPKTSRLVQDAGAIGASWEPAMVLRHGSGLKLLMERTWHVEANDGGEFGAPDWMLLDEHAGRLVRKWQAGK